MSYQVSGQLYKQTIWMMLLTKIARSVTIRASKNASPYLLLEMTGLVGHLAKGPAYATNVVVSEFTCF